ncbi:MAG: RelA/SpoT domain protein [Candidatus Shapirobacteria bacterium GW2011_GWE1_38_10]|uniref:RelA/SpoT domain protein n=1 Tax=Candidatus Shapirobacteria bacterium GW2011_GWE1_38_10 TaxID=1618488 RepID=A0A0G0I6A1_9BACT|nr:MAG: RelA/SpoT domain protein [Candidatus Shapirobacteria bacterium GW2011_GWF2_37_20]KKQ50858.1 MAG: RelA/SpoT domain protein [Candidatus Shapirobacteria bacterium GW2011_GWE1_38_10]KKQ63625.1 MAG: RelA/SpoT domain protein [Candidatus Shapirobacteria bacterium GW2011_GWF1_38_23]HBP51071.1 hypothetical protein [Candidatus Shapirobacteria bacterium]
MAAYEKEKLYKEYQKRKESLEKLKESVVTDISSLLKSRGIVVNTVKGRVKDFESFYQKIERLAESGALFDSPCDEIQDLVGVRIVLLFVSDLDKVESMLGSVFKVKSKKRFSENMPDNQFGYQSDHYVLMYGNKVRGPQYGEVKDINFELQVRTVLMDAWDSVSHELDYKNDIPIPSNMRRVFYGLSGLFVVADQQFQQMNELIIKNRKGKKVIGRPIDLLEREINLDTLMAYGEYKFQDRFVKKDKIKSGVDKYYFELAKEIEQLRKYNSIADIDEIVDKRISEVYAKEKKEHGGGTVFFTVIGLIRVALTMEDPDYALLLKNKAVHTKE